MSEQSESTASLFGLGRPAAASGRATGLAGLVRGTSTAAATPSAAPADGGEGPVGGPRAMDLPLGRLSANPDNPRETLGDVSELAASLREVGLVQPLTVATIEAYLKKRPERASELTPGADFVVIEGHRRLAAAREAGIAQLRSVVDDTRVETDEKLLEAAFVANYHREGLTDLEQAHALESLVKFYGSQGKAAKRLGISQGYISQKLSLLKLTPELQADLSTGRRTEEEVRNLGGKKPEEQKAAADARRAKADKAAAGKRDNRTATAPQAEDGDPHHGVMGESDIPTVAAATSDRSEAPSLRWDDPHAIANLIKREMSSDNIAILRKALDEQR